MSVSRYLDWRLALLYTVLGPLAGVAPMLVSVALSGEASANLDLFGIFLAWAYLFGALPAALTGLLLPTVVNFLPQAHRRVVWLYLAAATLLGFGLSWLLFATLTPFSPVKLAALGAFSALVCAAASRLLRVGPNNSSKPTPLRGAA